MTTPRLATRQCFTTGQIARLCECSPRIVAKWIDSGLLRGWKMPFTGARRVYRDRLKAFLHQHGLIEVWERLVELEARNVTCTGPLLMRRQAK